MLCVCGGPHKARDCYHRYDSTSKRARIVDDEAPQRKFEGKCTCCAHSDAYPIRVTWTSKRSHWTPVNASSLDGCVEVMHAPSTIKTAHLGDTTTSNLSANVDILKDVIVMVDNHLEMNLAFDKTGCRVVFEQGMGVVYDADGNTLVEATLTNDLYIFDMRDTMRDGREPHLLDVMDSKGP